MKKLIFVILTFLIFSLNSQAQWVRANGPFGGNAASLFYYNGKLYAGTYCDGYYSTNLGVSWSVIPGLSGKDVRSFASIGNNLFAGTQTGVYLSTNDGANWSPANGGLNYLRISSLAVSGNALIAAFNAIGSVGGIYRTTNNGQNWTSSVSPGNFWSLHSSGTNVYAGSFGSGFFVSTNGGVNFTEANNGLGNMYVYGITSLGSSVFAGTNTGVYKTSDNGQNWSLSNSGMMNNYVRCIYTSGSNLFAGTTNNIYLSINGGTSWSEVMTGLPLSYFNTIFTFGANTYAGTDNGIFCTTNNGSLWTDKNSGLTVQEVWDLLYTNGYVIAATYKGVSVSSDYGDNWLNTGLNNYRVSKLRIFNSYIFAITSGGIFKSTNSGFNWTPTGYTKNNVESTASTSTAFIIGTHDNGVCRTTNNGNTWDTVNAGLPSRDITGMGSYNGIVYAGTYGEGTFKSTDNGNTWTSINFEGHIMDFAFDGNNIMVGRCDSVFRTSNGGQNWFPVCTGLTMFCENTRIYQSGTNIFLSSCGILFLTTNFGTNWRVRNQGMENYGITSFTFAGDKVLAGTYMASVWRRGLTEIIGIQKISSEVPEKFSLSQNYPNPFNPTTKISYKVESYKVIKLAVFDVLGKEIEVLVNEKQSPGTYEVSWDGSSYPSGVYYYQLTSEDFNETKKMVLVK